MSENNTLDIQEMRVSGILQEVNRQFFHPLGLSLRVSTSSEDTQLYSFTAKTPDGKLVSGTVALPANQEPDIAALKDIRWIKKSALLDSIEDERDDPEGYGFPDEMLDHQKAQNVADLKESKADARKALFGDPVQPIV